MFRKVIYEKNLLIIYWAIYGLNKKLYIINHKNIEIKYQYL